MFQELRRAHNDTQEELAHKLGTYAAQISRLESASRNPMRWLNKIKEVYDIDEDVLKRFESLVKNTSKTFTLSINITNIDSDTVSDVKAIVINNLIGESGGEVEPA
jgi:transcriptional regulator with XRE-family HTH domain